MIGHLKGRIINKNPPEVLIEVKGIGYEVLCPMSTFYELDNLSEDILLFTHLYNLSNNIIIRIKRDVFIYCR